MAERLTKKEEEEGGHQALDFFERGGFGFGRF